MFKGNLSSFFATRRREPQEFVPAFFGTDRPSQAEKVASMRALDAEDVSAHVSVVDHSRRVARIAMSTFPDPDAATAAAGQKAPRPVSEPSASPAVAPPRVGQAPRTTQQDERVMHLAYHDALTDLPNRRAVEDRLEESLAIAKRSGTSVGVIFLDIDGFKQINDTFGHQVGDRVLVDLAARVRQTVRMGETVGRFGGDEFAAVYPAVQSNEELADAAGRLLRVFSHPLSVEGREFQLSASLGVATYPGDGGDVTELLQHADAAMYRAKTKGKGTICWYSVELGEELRTRRELIDDLRGESVKREFFLCYQPIVDVVEHDVVAVEALLRWLHPSRGLLAPSRLAETTRAIPPEVDSWVIAEVLEHIRTWQKYGLNVRVNVNVSNIDRAAFAKVDTALADQHGDPSLICFEIAEKSVLLDASAAIEFAGLCRARGIGVALDSFSGAVNLTELRRLPIDYLKLSPQIVSDLSDGGTGKTIADAAINVARSFGWAVIAAGVETREQQDWLFEAGVRLMQGYGKGLPMTYVDFSNWLSVSSPRVATD
ncbi:MAG: putative bifunctional diguanylate cyclase/phosphodiesterase [Vulcanimicrobiaceae bacterium]